MEYTMICTDCGKKKVFSARTLRGLHDKARDEGWAVSADYDRKWCPDCAEPHRHVGRRGSTRPYVQIKINV